MSDSFTRRGMGALPPPEFAWQMGRTARDISFVRFATEQLEWLEVDPGLKHLAPTLRDWIEAVKNGESVPFDMSKTPDWSKMIDPHYEGGCPVFAALVQRYSPKV